jgi:hypothetical protein
MAPTYPGHSTPPLPPWATSPLPVQTGALTELEFTAGMAALDPDTPHGHLTLRPRLLLMFRAYDEDHGGTPPTRKLTHTNARTHTHTAATYRSHVGCEGPLKAHFRAVCRLPHSHSPFPLPQTA